MMFVFITLCYVILSLSKKTWLYFVMFLIPEFYMYLLNFVNAIGIVRIKEWYVYTLSIAVVSYIFTLKKTTRRTQIACVLLAMFSLVIGVDAYLYGEGGVRGMANTKINELSTYFAFGLHFYFICSFINVESIKNDIRATLDSLLFDKVGNYGCDFSSYEVEECKS